MTKTLCSPRRVHQVVQKSLTKTLKKNRKSGFLETNYTVEEQIKTNMPNARLQGQIKAERRGDRWVTEEINGLQFALPKGKGRSFKQVLTTCPVSAKPAAERHFEFQNHRLYLQAALSPKN